MTVFVLPILLVFFVFPLVLAVLVVLATTQPQRQPTQRRPRDE